MIRKGKQCYDAITKNGVNFREVHAISNIVYFAVGGIMARLRLLSCTFVWRRSCDCYYCLSSFHFIANFHSPLNWRIMSHKQRSARTELDHSVSFAPVQYLPFFDWTDDASCNCPRGLPDQNFRRPSCFTGYNSNILIFIFCERVLAPGIIKSSGSILKKINGSAYWCAVEMRVEN